MLQAVPAPPTDPGPVASDLAPTPRQPVGSGRRRSSADCRWTATSANSPSSRSLAISSTTKTWPAALLARRARGRAARLRREHAESFSPLPGRRFREQPQPRAKRSTNDEPSEPIDGTHADRPATQFGQRGQAPRSRASGAAEGAGLDWTAISAWLRLHRGRCRPVRRSTRSPYTVAPHHQDAGDLIGPKSPTNSAREPYFSNRVSRSALRVTAVAVHGCHRSRPSRSDRAGAGTGLSTGPSSGA